MSSRHQFHLRWSNYGHNLANSFIKLFESESLADVTLFCDGKSNQVKSSFCIIVYQKSHIFLPVIVTLTIIFILHNSILLLLQFWKTRRGDETKMPKICNKVVVAPLTRCIRNAWAVVVSFVCLMNAKKMLAMNDMIMKSILVSKNNGFMLTGESYRAHRVVLAASSVHFQELFEQCSGAQNLVVILDGTTPVNLRALLEFMYKGEVYVDDANLNTFLQTAKRLQVRRKFTRKSIKKRKVNYCGKKKTNKKTFNFLTI